MLRRLTATTTFRFALLYVGLFAASVLLLLGFIYWITSGLLDRQIDATLDAEIAGLAEQYQQRGLVGLVRAVEARSIRPGDDEGGRPVAIYLLIDVRGRPLAGNIDSWPSPDDPDTNVRGQWIDFPARHAQSGDPARIRARAFQLVGGFHLLVGRDLSERQEFRDLIMEAIAWSLAVSLLLGLTGGVVMSRRMLGRLDGINDAASRIITGALDQRMPVSDGNDEFDRLSINLNAMLERISDLMQGLRTAGDNIAHDLRSPLTRLKLRLEELHRGLDESASLETRNAAAAAIEDADDLLRTFDAVLRIARAESGADRALFEPVDLSALAREAGDLFGPACEAAGLELKVETQGDLVVHGHRQLLAQAVANLIDNAIKYAADGDLITISARRNGAACDLSVRDAGPGVPLNERASVVRRFHRLDASRASPGVGLGLSLVNAVASLHMGALTLDDASVDSRPPGLDARLSIPAQAD